MDEDTTPDDIMSDEEKALLADVTRRPLKEFGGEALSDRERILVLKDRCIGAIYDPVARQAAYMAIDALQNRMALEGLHDESVNQ